MKNEVRLSLTTGVRPAMGATQGGDGARRSVRPGFFGDGAEDKRGAAIWKQGEARAENDDDSSEPDYFYERVEIGVDHGLARLGITACVNNVKIVLRRALDSDHCLRDFTGGEITARRIEHHFGFAIAEDFESGAVRLKIRIDGLIEILAEDGVRTDIEALPDGHFRLVFDVESPAGDTDKNEHHSEMDDVTAVAAGVAHGEIADGSEDVDAIPRGDDAGAAIKLRKNRKAHKHSKDETDQSVEIAESEDEGDDSGKQGSRKRPREVALERVPGSLAPGEERAYSGEQKQEKRDGNVYFVKERGPDADFASHDPFGKNGKERAPEHSKARGEQDQIVEQKAGFAGDERIQLIVTAKVIAIHPPGGKTDNENQRKETNEPRSDGGLRERMNGTDGAGTREQRSENGEHIGDEDEPDVPDFHHAALFLHHHRVQESGGGNPGKQRSIFHRVPRPVAAPTENRVGPVGAKKNADGLKAPGDHRPAARDVNPFFAGIAAEKRGERESERNRETGVAEVKHRRMDIHLRILKKWSEAFAVGQRSHLGDAV